MTAHIRSRVGATIDISHLRIGGTYEATTHTGEVAVGEYLGIEVAYDEWRVLLRHDGGTESVPVDDLASVHAVAA